MELNLADNLQSLKDDIDYNLSQIQFRTISISYRVLCQIGKYQIVIYHLQELYFPIFVIIFFLIIDTLEIIDLNHKFQMEKFITPIKENCYPNWKTNPQREGDWICSNCNNLNFSFRKKCNRCKIQTKEQNNVGALYSYYYYIEENKPNQMRSHEPLKQHNLQQQRNISTPTREKRQKKPQLPSVSPLVKKYRDSKIKQHRENNSVETQNNQMLDFKNFSNKSLNALQMIDFNDFENQRKTNQNNVEEDIWSNEELQRIIGKIML